MKELIKVRKRIVGEDEINAVDARGLHEFLEVETRFDQWISRRIKEYGFVINSDFCTSLIKSTGGRPRTEYIIALDMAKELSMVERNSKGKEARLYFIKCEKKWRRSKSKHIGSGKPSSVLEEELKIFELFKVPEHIAQTESVKQVKEICNVDLSYALKHAPAQNNVAEEEVMLEPTELGKLFGLKPNEMNKKLMKLGLQVKNGSNWIPKKEGKKISAKHHWKMGWKTGYNLKWQVKRIKEIMK